MQTASLNDNGFHLHQFLGLEDTELWNSILKCNVSLRFFLDKQNLDQKPRLT